MMLRTLFRSRSLSRVALLLLALNTTIWAWQNPGFWRGPITADEAEGYLASVAQVPLPAAERDAVLAALRRFMAEDDGQPLQMLNLMRYYAGLRPTPGSAIDFTGTTAESNAYYERAVMPTLFAVGGYPSYAGSIDSTNLIGKTPALDNWSRVLLVRYPNRRAFMELLTHPDYAPLAPYKLQALQLVLTPTRSEIQIPPLTLTVAMLSLIVFLALGWWHAACRRPHAALIPSQSGGSA